MPAVQDAASGEDMSFDTPARSMKDKLYAMFSTTPEGHKITRPESFGKRFIQRITKLFGGPTVGPGRTPSQLLVLRWERRKNRRLLHAKKRGGGGARPRPEIKPKRVKQTVTYDHLVCPKPELPRHKIGTHQDCMVCAGYALGQE